MSFILIDTAENIEEVKARTSPEQLNFMCRVLGVTPEKYYAMQWAVIQEDLKNTEIAETVEAKYIEAKILGRYVGGKIIPAPKDRLLPIDSPEYKQWVAKQAKKKPPTKRSR